MCVHGEEEGKWARAILYLCGLSSVKHLSQIYFVMGLHQKSKDRDIRGVQSHPKLINLIVKNILQAQRGFFLSLPQIKLN